MCKFHYFSCRHGVAVGNDKSFVRLFPVKIKHLASLCAPTPDVAPLSYIPLGSLENVTILGLGVGGLILSLCTLFFLRANFSLSSDSR